jgi:hypothetical protein
MRLLLAIMLSFCLELWCRSQLPLLCLQLFYFCQIISRHGFNFFFHLKIETEIDADEEAGESDPEENGELDLSRVSEMRIILADPSQCILFLCA